MRLMPVICFVVIIGVMAVMYFIIAKPQATACKGGRLSKIKTMIIETYRATLKHDTGMIRIKVISLSGEKGAIQQITTAEHCPECAIIKLKKINTKNYNDMKALNEMNNLEKGYFAC